jgi:diacylglycerol kinase family enzyme
MIASTEIAHAGAHMSAGSVPAGCRATRFAAVINLSAAGASQQRRAALRRALQQSLDLPDRAIRYADGASLRAVLAETAEDSPDAVIVYGGDGTARTAIEVLSPLGIAAAPLRGGTLNRLATAVHGARATPQIVERLAAGRATWIEGGRVGRRRFFVAAGFGAPMRLNGLREHLRAGDPAAALAQWRALAPTLFSTPIELGRLGRRVSCAIVGVGRIDSAFGLRAPAARDAFEVASARWNGIADMAAMAPFALLGGWRTRPGVVAGAARCIFLRGDAAGIPALLDGEAVTLDREVIVQFEERCGLVWRAP